MRAARLKRFLNQVYWHLERRLAPGLRFSQDIYESVLARTVAHGSRWLDLGCGHRLLPPWRQEGAEALVAKAGVVFGVDPELGALRNHRTIKNRVAGHGSCLPFASESFDLVTANLVVEHLATPVTVFREVKRTLRPGGRFVFHTPNSRSHFGAVARMMPERMKAIGVAVLEGRSEYDRFRTYYRANSQAEINLLAQQSGFRVASLEFIPTTAMFAVVPPLAVVELLWIRLTMRWWPQFRTNLIVTLERT